MTAEDAMARMVERTGIAVWDARHEVPIDLVPVEPLTSEVLLANRRAQVEWLTSTQAQDAKERYLEAVRTGQPVKVIDGDTPGGAS